MEDTNLSEPGITAVERKHLVEDARYAFGQGPSRMVNVGESERWLSAAGGTGMVAYGLKTRGLMGLTLGAIGAALLYRGLTGHCSGYSALGISTAEEQHTRASLDEGIKIEESIFVAADQVTLFQYWRNLSNLPQVMSHLKSVKEMDKKRSHWVAKGPLDTSVEWDAEIINERENELIAWRSLEGSQVANAGSVRFTRDTAGAGTMIKVSLLYNPPAGKLGQVVSSMLGQNPSVQVAEDLKRFKESAEAGKLNGAAVGA
jgi:uncharacterized membrane protein